MAVISNSYFRILNSTEDPTGSTEIAIGAELGVIGGGQVDEQGAILENTNHLWASLNLATVFGAQSFGSGASQSPLCTESATTYQEQISTRCTVGEDRNLDAVVDYIGQVQVIAYTTGGAILDSLTTSSSPTAQALESGALDVSGETEILIKVFLKKTDTGSQDGELYGVRCRETATTL